MYSIITESEKCSITLTKTGISVTLFTIIGSLLDVLSTLPIGFCIITKEGRAGVGVSLFFLNIRIPSLSLDILIWITENVDKMISVNVFHLILMPGGGKRF